MEAKFYIRDDNYIDCMGRPASEKDLLFFSLSRKAKGAGFETTYDNRATPDHVKNYPAAFQAFRTLNPQYVCKWEGREDLLKDGVHTASRSAFSSNGPIEAAIDKEFKAEKSLEA